MMHLAFDVLAITALIGAGLAVHYLRGPAAKAPHPLLLLVHGALGTAGLGLLLAVLHHGLPQTDNGTSGFGIIAAACFGVALAFGLVIALVVWRGRRPSGFVIATHASIAIAGLVVLATLVVLG
ncbi:MAG: hypothetical protein WCF13_04320 [Stellaceae bacterium]